MGAGGGIGEAVTGRTEVGGGGGVSVERSVVCGEGEDMSFVGRALMMGDPKLGVSTITPKPGVIFSRGERGTGKITCFAIQRSSASSSILASLRGPTLHGTARQFN